MATETTVRVLARRRCFGGIAGGGRGGNKKCLMSFRIPRSRSICTSSALSISSRDCINTPSGWGVEAPRAALLSNNETARVLAKRAERGDHSTTAAGPHGQCQRQPAALPGRALPRQNVESVSYNWVKGDKRVSPSKCCAWRRCAQPCASPLRWWFLSPGATSPTAPMMGQRKRGC